VPSDHTIDFDLQKRVAQTFLEVFFGDKGPAKKTKRSEFWSLYWTLIPSTLRLNMSQMGILLSNWIGPNLFFTLLMEEVLRRCGIQPPQFLVKDIGVCVNSLLFSTLGVWIFKSAQDFERERRFLVSWDKSKEKITVLTDVSYTDARPFLQRLFPRHFLHCGSSFAEALLFD